MAIIPPATVVPGQYLHVSPESIYSVIGNAPPDFAPGIAFSSPSVGRIFYVPFRLPVPVEMVELWLSNGTTASGNFDIGIYDVAGTRLVSTGSTAQSGTSTIQVVDVTDTLLGPGIFYLAYLAISGTPTVRCKTANAPLLRLAGMAQQTVSGGSTLPATATFVANTNTFIPHFGLRARSLA